MPVRAGAKAFADWVAAPRLRPATRLQPVGEPEGGGHDCANGSCETPDRPSSDQPSSGPPASDYEPPSTPTQAERGPAGPAGPKGEKGDPGEPGPAGPPGEVDYDKVQEMIAAVVGESLKQMQPQIEDSLLNKMAEDDRFKAATPDRVAQQMIILIQQNPELQELLRGPPGKDGKDGLDGRPAEYEPPSNGAEWSHLVLIMPRDAYYYPRISAAAKQAQAHYNGLQVVDPPADRNIGELPVLVAYQGGSAAKTFYGSRKVEAALAAIVRGEFDEFLFPQGESDGT